MASMSVTISQPRIILVIINYVLFSIGLFKLFPKMGVEKKYAIIPFYRLYKLAYAVDKEEEGLNLLILNILTYTITPIYLFFEEGLYYGNQRWTAIIILGFLMAIVIAMLVYEIRIYYAVCRAFNKKGIWVLIWLVANWIPAIIWGFNKNVPPIQNIREKAARISGLVAQESNTGLTINITSRKVFESFRRKYLLRDIHMNIKPGRMVLLLGGSGAGKTTLINAIIGYEPAKAKILLNGVNVYKQYEKMKYQIAMVPQQDLMRYDDSVQRTLTDSAVLRLPEEVSKKERNEKVQEVLNEFGLSSVKDSEVEKLSGGQRKRLSIAMEFISDPYLFVLDEPDSGLDGVMARDLMVRLQEIAHQGKMVIVITHSPDRVIDLFDDVIVLGKDANKIGRLVFFGSIEESKEFFGTDKMEEIVKMINRKDEGGQGRADELIEKYTEAQNGKQL